jgi:hypothetical protein
MWRTSPTIKRKYLYQEEVLADYPQPKGWTYVEIKPHTGLTYIGEGVMLIGT